MNTLEIYDRPDGLLEAGLIDEERLESLQEMHEELLEMKIHGRHEVSRVQYTYDNQIDLDYTIGVTVVPEIKGYEYDPRVHGLEVYNIMEKYDVKRPIDTRSYGVDMNPPEERVQIRGYFEVTE